MGNTLFEGLKRILLRSLDSPMNAQLILKRLVDEEGIDPNNFGPRDLERVFDSVVFVSIRLFVPPHRLPDVMLELADLAQG